MEYHTDIQQKPIGTDPAPVHAKKPARTGLFVWGIVIIAIIAIGINGLSAPGAFPDQGGIFTITPGEDLKILGTSLQAEHFIRSPFVFDTLVSAMGGEHRISPGDYFFSRPAGVLSIARQIAQQNHNLSPVKITIPEGDTVKDISAVLSGKLPSFQSSVFLTDAKQYEGYLFPETYFLYPKTGPDAVISDMRAMFETQTADIFTKQALGSHTKSDVVIMASLVEREAHGSDDRATIAGILWNRLSIGMALQVDAAVAYAANKGDGQLVKSDLSIDSPYNTYTHKGLPPGPISNPGLAALQAALNPVATSYLYYLHDKHGTIHYAKTYAEHMANIKKYL